MRDVYDRMIEGMFNSDVRALCHLLLLKRSVDGLNGRTWDAHEHMDYERSIQETLKMHNATPDRTSDQESSVEGLVDSFYDPNCKRCNGSGCLTQAYGDPPEQCDCWDRFDPSPVINKKITEQEPSE